MTNQPEVLLRHARGIAETWHRVAGTPVSGRVMAGGLRHHGYDVTDEHAADLAGAVVAELATRTENGESPSRLPSERT